MNNRPSFRQLQVFCAVVQESSFRRAAELLNTSQPAISKSIKDLEQLLQTQLLVRSTRTVEVSFAGQELYTRSLDILSSVDEAVNSTLDVASGQAGTLHISHMDFAIIGPLPNLIGQYRRSGPDVRVYLRHEPTPVQIDLVLQQKVDVAFVSGQPELPDCETQVLNSEGLTVALPENHALAQCDSLRLCDLEKENFVSGDRTWRVFTDLIVSLCQQKGFTPQFTQSAHHRDAIFGFVVAGLGVALYPRSIENWPRPGLTYVPIADVEPVVHMSALWHKGNRNPVLPSFLKTLGAEPIVPSD